jgi:hypothetical protein
MVYLSHLPSWLCGVIIVSSFVVLSIIGLALFQWLIVGRLRLTEEMNNDIIFSHCGVLQPHSRTDRSGGMDDLQPGREHGVGRGNSYRFYRDIGGYPGPARTRLQAQVREYTVFLIEQAWPAQRRGKSTDVAPRRLSALAQELVRFEPATLGQQVLHAETFRQYNEVAGLRRQRLHSIGAGLPSVMWSVVLIGAFLTITVTYLLKMQRIVHFVLTGFFAMFIGLVVFVIISLDQPLSGPLAIDSGPYQLVLDRLIDLK